MELKVIDTFNDLIETCKDGEYGFRASAEHAKSPALRTLFERRALDCALAAEQLAQRVLAAGGRPETGGTASGALHRGWIAVRGQLAGYSDLALLESCERGEDIALDSYRNALAADLPAADRELVAMQFEAVKRSHQQIRELRNDERVRSL
ncbi:MAG: PA2169 family four-helix-bundle protein [Burkholderiales bacterium]|nr:PA2169 family four-helix-bundle protein [Burkholderiales bacterium]